MGRESYFWDGAADSMDMLLARSGTLSDEVLQNAVRWKDGAHSRKVIQRLIDNGAKIDTLDFGVIRCFYQPYD